MKKNEVKLTTEGFEGRVIEVREPKVRDMRAVSHISDELDKEVALLANLTGLTEEEIDSLKFKDFSALDEVLQGFLV